MSNAREAPVVMKFGGAALADGAGVRRACAILAEHGGEGPIAVVSAAHGVTDLLAQVAQAAAAGRQELERVRVRHRTLLSQCGLDQELLDRLLLELGTVLEGVRSRRTLTAAERDFVLSFGERMSARIVAASLCAAGSRATPVDAFDLGLLSDSNHGRARPLAGSQAAIRRALSEVPGIPVVTGFLAKDAAGNLTTLGRNGSDLSASLLGEAAGAREVQFWKDVRAVMTADPALVPNAREVAHMSYAAAAEYAHRGAKVLHPAALAPLERAGISARVLCLSRPHHAGTIIGSEQPAQDRSAVGVTARIEQTLFHVELSAQEDRAQRASAFLARVADAELELAWIHFGARELSVVCSSSDAVAELLTASGEVCRVERGMAVAALVGACAADSVAASRALDEAGIEVRAQWSEPRSGSALFAIDETDVPKALRVMHAAVFEVRAESPVESLA